MELRLEAEAEPNEKVVKAFAAKTRIDAIYKAAANKGPNQEEGLRKMGLLHDWMIANGLL